MTIARQVMQSIEDSSWIGRLFVEGGELKAKYGAENVFDFCVGNPNLEPPERFKQVMLDLINDTTPGLHGYMPVAGLESTRKAVADYIGKSNKAQFSANDIVMTVGAGGGCNVVFKTILNPGDEMVIPAPCFFEYKTWLDNYQGVPRIVPSKDNFRLDIDGISNAISEKTKAVLINSPSNPTGVVYTENEIQELADVLSHHSKKLNRPIYLISDEPYRKIVYDETTVPSVFDLYDDSFVIASFSKDLSLPGERIGYIAINPNATDRDLLIQGLILCNRALGFTSAPRLQQRAVEQLLEENVDVSFYKRNRDLLCEGLASCGYEFAIPEGAFYLFPKAPIQDDIAFVAALKEENILVVPGSGFNGPGHFRISYCVAEETIKNALPGFKRVMEKFQK
jgi:aspartate aminotransferase